MATKSNRGFIKVFKNKSGVVATNAGKFDLLVGGVLFVLAIVRVFFLFIQAIRSKAYAEQNKSIIKRTYKH